MTKPHAQRIAIATGLTADEVRSFIDFNQEFGEVYETTQDVIDAIEWDRKVNDAFVSDLPLDHAMGQLLGRGTPHLRCCH